MFDKERSSFQSLRMFPTNTEAEARLTFRTSRSLGMDMVPDYRWIPVGVHYSILELPATPMRPRYADDRVDYFVSAMKNFSRDTSETFFVRYVNRWRLEKKDPSAAVSDAVKPITYYLDRTIPLEWRPYVRDGILEWNRAFAEAGIRNAIQVLEAPDDSLWSAEDARYSTVRWMANNAFTSQRARTTTSIRRDLQRLYLARLLRMVVTPEPGTPEDARTVARATLVSLSGALGRAQAPANELDGYTQAHFADSRQRIEQALNAQVVQPLGPPPPPTR